MMFIYNMRIVINNMKTCIPNFIFTYHCRVSSTVPFRLLLLRVSGFISFHGCIFGLVAISCCAWYRILLGWATDVWVTLTWRVFFYWFVICNYSFCFITMHCSQRLITNMFRILLRSVWLFHISCLLLICSYRNFHAVIHQTYVRI